MQLFLFLFILFVFFISFAVSITLYLLNGFGLMGLAKTCNEKYPFLGFVPYASIYLTGKIAFNNKKAGLIYLIVQISLVVVFYILYFGTTILGSILNINQTFIEIVSALVSILFVVIIQVITYIAMYRLYKRFTDNYVLYTVLTVLSFGMLAPVFTFSIRKNKILRY